jgi:outer membrane receptor protein involved in Fe transport
MRLSRFKRPASISTGRSISLPGGPLVAAIAGQTLSYHWTYQQLQNNNTQSTKIITNTKSAASQTSWALFGQLNIPVFGEDNRIPFFDSLIFELGYRYDKYDNLTIRCGRRRRP